MRVNDALSGIFRLGCDTAAFIYYVENDSRYLPVCDWIFNEVAFGNLYLLTSVTTLTEVLIHPLRSNLILLADNYRQILLERLGIETLPVSVDIAEKAAALRAQYNLRTPDAFQVATAIVAGCDAFLTNDADLRRVTEIPVLLISELTA